MEVLQEAFGLCRYVLYDGLWPVGLCFLFEALVERKFFVNRGRLLALVDGTVSCILPIKHKGNVDLQTPWCDKAHILCKAVLPVA